MKIFRSSGFLSLFAAAVALAVGVGVYLFDRPPALVRDLRHLPHVAKVDYTGPRADAVLTVVHIQDWHFYPEEMSTQTEVFESLQFEQREIARFLLWRFGSRPIYCEGLSAEAVPELRSRLETIRQLDALANSNQLDISGKRKRQELNLEVGVGGQLLMSKEINDVLPLEDEKTLEAVRPEYVEGEGNFHSAKMAARQRAMAARLPREGVALVVLGGDHDLGPFLPAGTLYVRVTPASWPDY